VYLGELVRVPQEVREGVLDVGQHGLDARLPPAVADQAHQGHAPAAPLVLAGREQRVVKQLLNNGRARQLLLWGAACSQDSLLCSTTLQVTTRGQGQSGRADADLLLSADSIQSRIDRETDDEGKTTPLSACPVSRHGNDGNTAGPCSMVLEMPRGHLRTTKVVFFKKGTWALHKLDALCLKAWEKQSICPGSAPRFAHSQTF
jgi:hypothetical protein